MNSRLYRPSRRAALASACLSVAITMLSSVAAPAVVTQSVTRAAQTRYMVLFEEPALSRYNAVASATAGAAAILIPHKQQANGRARLDVTSTQAKSYIAYLRSRQDQHLADIAAVIGRVPVTTQTMQHAVNAAILSLSADEAQRIARNPGVVSVEPDRPLQLASDLGPGFTSAASVWWGTSAGQDSIFANDMSGDDGYMGDGVVVGVIDTGYNSLSPSFQAVDVEGYRIANPLGHGVFLGQCGVAGISHGGCNDKVIGVYDEVGLTSGVAGWVYSVEDTVGHGSHTASTAAGDRRNASLNGYSAPLSGVAPHANLVIYRACTPDTGCVGSAIVAAVDNAIAGGLVDTLNFSISDTAGPWADPIAHAFLGAADAGIFVAAAAGNTDSLVPNQVAGSANNTAPWIATVGAGMHTGGDVVQGVRTTAHADELAAFSLIGPARFDVIKPDLQAPGAHILAATSNDGSADGANRVAMMDGTSMATAHTTGSSALLLGLHPDWTPLEVKSALMMTAKESGLTKADGVTASDYFDRGSGRLQEFPASKAGLVMDENVSNMTSADPTWGVGDPSTLNLASMENDECSGVCSFSRHFRSTQNHAVTWTARVVAGPSPGFTSVSVTPAVMTVNALATSPTILVQANTNNLAADGTFHFAEVVLTPSDKQLSPLHLIVAVAVPSP